MEHSSPGARKTDASGAPPICAAPTRLAPYRPYEAVVAEAAAEVGLSATLAAQLAARYGELEPWPEVREVLGALRREGVALGVVTNCSEELAAKAIACTGIDFDVVVTAERAGFYKPDPRPYEMALDELGVAPGRCLFVAGSAYDLFGTSKVGLRDLLARPHWHGAAIQCTRAHRAPPLALPAPRIGASCRVGAYSGRRVDCQVTICHWPPLLA